MAQGLMHGLDDRNMKICQEMEASKTFIYCIKLPGFKVAPRPGVPEYTMIKVGISTDPARRLCDIMRSFEGFGVAAAETQFKFIRESDRPDVTVEKGKKEDNVIFIQQCHSVKRPNGTDYESAIRQRIGRQELGTSFRDEFKKSIFDSLNKGDGEGYIDQVGMTEWVLASTTLIGQIQQYMRMKVWNFSLAVGCPSGDEFFRDLMSQKAQSQSRDPAQANGLIVPHKVKIEFLPTRFAYDQDILPVAR